MLKSLKMTKKLNWLLCFSGLLLVFSCNNTISEEDVDIENNLTNFNENPTSRLLEIYSESNQDIPARIFDSQKSEEKCFEFVYPISFILPDGSEVTVNNDEDWDQIDLWYEENKDAKEEPEIIYPFDVVIDDGKVVTITNEKDLEDLEEYCHKEDDDKDYEEECLAKIYGFHRSFCMKTKLGRGSFKKPGLMLGLDRGGSCRGSALKLKKSEAIKNIDILFRREMVTGVYKPKLLKTILEDGRKVMSLAFTVDKKHKNYFQNKAIRTKATMISNAHGFLGTCEEYFSNTLQSLSELNIVDSEMIAISKHLKKN